MLNRVIARGVATLGSVTVGVMLTGAYSAEAADTNTAFLCALAA